jgi:hypothetical protein
LSLESPSLQQLDLLTRSIALTRSLGLTVPLFSSILVKLVSPFSLCFATYHYLTETWWTRLSPESSNILSLLFFPYNPQYFPLSWLRSLSGQIQIVHQFCTLGPTTPTLANSVYPSYLFCAHSRGIDFLPPIFDYTLILPITHWKLRTRPPLPNTCRWVHIMPPKKDITRSCIPFMIYFMKSFISLLLFIHYSFY